MGASITTQSQAALLKRQFLTLKVISSGPVTAWVGIRYGGRFNRFADRRIRLRRAATRTISLRLTAAGRKHLSTCGKKKVTAVIRFRRSGRKRRVTAHRSLARSAKACEKPAVVSPSSLSFDPPLFPDFSPAVSDYVTRCDGSPVRITASSGAGNRIDIDNQGERTGTFSTEVPLQANQGFDLVRETPSGETTHHVRCLPAGFPAWTYEKFRTPSQAWYLVNAGNYNIFFDANGVPVWWFESPDVARNLTYLSDGTVSWGNGDPGGDSRYEIRSLDGSLLNTLRTVGSETDIHDLELLPNGNYMMIASKHRAGPTDLTQYGGPAEATVMDAELQEVTPAGDLVWAWDSADHIGLDETGHWWQDYVLDFGQRTGLYDVVHINSIDVSDDSIVLSMRHNDAIYKLDRGTGEIVWKLGGTHTARSLTVSGDPFGANPLGGQHDARILADGTLTTHDNGYEQDRPPRASRYRIDQGAMKASLIESMTDPEVPEALCCGSARRSEDGSWLMAWGGLGSSENHPVVEYDSEGRRNFRLAFTGEDVFSYRATTIAPGVLSATLLRQGMDTRFPR